MTHSSGIEVEDSRVRSDPTEWIDVATFITKHDDIPLREVGPVIDDALGVPPGGNQCSWRGTWYRVFLAC